MSIDNKNLHIILASKSERRKDILKREGYNFEVYVPETKEKDIIGEKYSEELVRECAREKAEAAYKELKADGRMVSAPTISAFALMTIIVSCDTVVVNDGIIVGKPKDKEDAKRILKSLSGSRHRVISAVCICKDGEYCIENDTTYVKFRNLTNEEIENYIDERKPYDKAGSYGIQDEKFDFVESIEGSMDNVVGFPIEKFKEMIRGLA